MKIKKYLNEYLPKGRKAECNQLGKRYRRLEERAEKDESDSFHSSDEPSVIRDRIIELMSSSVKRYAETLFKGVKQTEDDDDAFQFCGNLGDDSIEVFCVKRGKKGWVASVVTNYWDAPESTCDDSTCVPTPAEAFEWGFGDAMAYHFINEEVK
jgi:hypothetical protein